MEEFSSHKNPFSSGSLSEVEHSNPYGLDTYQTHPKLASSNTFLVTSASDSGEGSLREAIQMANDTDGFDLVVLSDDLKRTIKLNTEIAITDDVIIEGRGKTIKGSGEDRLFVIDDGDAGTMSQVKIHDMILTGGVANGSEATSAAGGAIYSAEALTVDEVVIKKNFASRFGAGIFNFQGHLTVKDSLIAGNDDIAAEDGTFYGIYGGGIYNYRGITHITDTLIKNHDIERCGTVFNEAGFVLMEGTTIKKNTTLHGGAILNLNALTVLLDTKLAKNTAREWGGGVANFATLEAFAGPFGRTEAGGEFESIAPSILVMSSDSVIKKNTAVDYGGGIFNGDDEGFFTEGTLIGVKEGINVLKNKKEDVFGPTKQS